MDLHGIKFNNHKISRVVTSSIMGHYGNGIFPLTMTPSYCRFAKMVREYEVTNFTKSSTANKRVGNFILHKPWTWKYVQKIDNLGMLNAYGLTNDGIAANAPKINHAIKQGYKVIPNFYPEFIKGREIAAKETVLALHILESELLLNFWAVELNYSCPNSKEEIKKNVEDTIYCTKSIRQKFPSACIIAKISYVHPYEFAQELVSAGADVIHGINAIYFKIIFPGQTSPLNGVGDGAVSGKPAFSKMLEYNKGLRKAISVPIIMGCGITSVDDVEKCIDIGADSVSICSIARLNEKETEKIIYKYI